MMAVDAPAKLNLHLQVLERKADGYHGIVSVFQAVSLADRLVLRSLKDTRGVELHGSFDCPPHANTIVRAARAWLAAAEMDAGVEIRVVKRIPAGAGLGGGSSDAAAALKALEALFDIHLERDTLAGIARELGSDVPFFLGSARALVTGRGELLEPLHCDTPFHVVIVDPGFPIRTLDAYRALDASRASPERRIAVDPEPAAIKEALTGTPAAWPFRNDFLEVVARSHPVILSVIGRLEAGGAVFAGLSGSGSACYGLFPDRDDADAVAVALKGEGLSAFSCAALARLPEPGYNSALDSAVG